MNTIITMKKNHNHIFTIQLMECALVLLLFHLSYLLSGKLIYYDSFPFGGLRGALLYAVISGLAVMILRAYKYFSFIGRPVFETAMRMIATVMILNFTFIVLLYLNRSIILSPYYFIVAGTFQIMCLFLIKRLSGLLKTEIRRKMVSLVIGKDGQKNELLNALRKQSIGKLTFVSFKDLKLTDYLEKADFIYVSGSLSKKLKDKIISYCVLKHKRIYIVPETYEIAVRKSEMSQIGDIPVFDIESFQLTEAQNMVKRWMDIALSLVGIVFASPIMLYAMIRIKLEDGGQIFYKQVRSGLNGKEYEVIKFRSMVVDAEKYTGAVFAAEDDPRITRIGRLMRATRIDEIPQFFNVLTGSMSMVGPRPERPVFVEEFSKEIPEYTNRLAVKPGITGLAQVMGNYTTSAENKVRFDLVYIRDYSLLLDFKILLKTVKVVLTKEQAEGFCEKDKGLAFDLPAEMDPDGTLGLNCRGGFQKCHRVKKLILVSLCFFLIISGSIFLRYSAVAMAMMEASVQPVLAEEASKAEHTDADPGLLNSRVDAADADESITVAADSWDSVYEPGKSIDGQSLGQDADEESLQNPDKIGTFLSGEADKEPVVLSQSKINTALGKMTLSQKAEIAYKLISKMNAADLMVLEKLSEGGFTADEKIAAKEMMYRYFDETEVEYIKSIYWEYVE